MTKEQAIEILKESFSRPCSTPDFNAEDREVFLNNKKAELLSLVTEPFIAQANTNEWTRKWGVLPEETYQMYVIAGNEEHWLLYDSNTKNFSQARGNPKKILILIGHASDDALAEWNG